MKIRLHSFWWRMSPSLDEWSNSSSPLQFPRYAISSWGSLHLARWNSQRERKVLPSDAQRGFWGEPAQSKLQSLSLSWSTLKNLKEKKRSQTNLKTHSSEQQQTEGCPRPLHGQGIKAWGITRPRFSPLPEASRAHLNILAIVCFNSLANLDVLYMNIGRLTQDNMWIVDLWKGCTCAWFTPKSLSSNVFLLICEFADDFASTFTTWLPFFWKWQVSGMSTVWNWEGILPDLNGATQFRLHSPNADELHIQLD